MYTIENFKTKKALKEAIAEGKKVSYYQPGLGPVPLNGNITLEGPHYAHKWYAQAVVKDGYIVSVK